MAESLESFKSYVGKSETATDVVTAAAMGKFAATLGLENPSLEKGSPIPPGWYGGLFQTAHPNPRLLFRFSAIRFNSHRIHYDRDYVTKVEKLPGLVVQSSLISQLLMEMCRRELPGKRMTNFDFQNMRSVYDSDGKFTLHGKPSNDSREATPLAVDGKSNLAMLVTAKFT